MNKKRQLIIFGGQAPVPIVNWALGIDLNPISNLWQDVARTTPASVNNDPVASALYKPAGYVVNAVDANRPLLKLNSLNGWPSLQFDGLSDSLYDAGFSFTNPFTVFAVIRANAGAPDIILDSTSAAANRFVMNTDGTGVAYQCQGVNNYYLNTAGKYVILEAVVGGATPYFAVNGLQIFGSMGASNWAGLRLGIHPTGVFPLDGNYARLLGGTNALNSADAYTIRKYLSSLYNIPSWPDSTMQGSNLVIDSVGVTTGIFYVGNIGNVRQILSGPAAAFSGYLRFTGLNTQASTTKGLVRITTNHVGAPAAPGFTAAEARHAGIQICSTNADNNYILMISAAAGALGENDIQLVKQVAGVETILYLGQCSEAITAGVYYQLELRRNGANVEGVVKKTDGTVIGSCTVADSSLLTGNSGLHGFSVTYEAERVWIE